MIAPEMFVLSDVDGSSSAVSEVVPADQEEAVCEASRSCPEQAIVVEEISNGSSGADAGQKRVREATS
jgi:ferredoxin